MWRARSTAQVDFDGVKVALCIARWTPQALIRLGTDNPLGDQQLGFPILGGRTCAPPDSPIYMGGLCPPTPPLNVGLRPPQSLAFYLIIK
jgi:hypothetical protein